MIDWLTILIALAIIAVLIGIFGFMAWKINMPDPLLSTSSTGKKDDTNQLLDSGSDKRNKDKTGNQQLKNKRKEQKKSKRDKKEEHHNTVKFKEPIAQTSEETDNEREESDQESSTPLPTPQVAEASSKARKRNRNKARPSTPPPSTSTRSSGHIESILINKDEKSPVTTEAPPIPHPKLAAGIPKDEVELAKQHHHQGKAHGKSSQGSNKPTMPVPVKTTVQLSTNVNQGIQNQQEQEQPFTTVVSNRHKAGTPPLQQQQQQPKAANTTSTTNTVPVVASQQQAPVQIQHEQLAQRQPPPPRQQKETSTQHNGLNANSLSVKPQATAAPIAIPPAKLADLVKALPTTQAVVTELMSAFDAVSLSTDELDIIMHKIANKQSVVKQDWTKLQHGQKVDPQAHIGQVMNESARAYEEDLRNNAMRRVKELTDELNNEKRRINDLIKEKNEKDMNIQRLQTQLGTIHNQQQSTQLNPQQQQHLQTLQIQVQRLTDDNMQLNQRLTQQQQFSSLNLIGNNNTGDSTNVQVRVFSEQMKKLSVDNANLEKKVAANELLLKDVQKEKDSLIRTNQQLREKVQDIQKQFQHDEEKLVKDLNESRTLHMNQLNEYQRRIEQLTLDNEKLRREEIVHVEPTKTSAPPPPQIMLNNEEREKLEQEINQLKQTVSSNQQRFEQQQKEYHQLNEENEQYKNKLDEIQTQYKSHENEFRQEVERLKQEKNSEQTQRDETRNNELAAKDTQIDALRAELDDVKAKNDSIRSQLDERLRQAQDRQKHFLSELLQQDVRNQLPNDNQDFDQWFSSYRQIFESSVESSKRALQDESAVLKRENDQLHKNMTEVESQLKVIEQTVQSKEESLLTELKSKDATLESIRDENDQLNGEMQRLQAEIERLQLAHDAAVTEARALKLQLDERFLVTTNSSSVTADESFELIKQPSPPSIDIDTRAEEFNQLIRSSKEALENQDSLVQQLDKHISDMHRGGTGETSTSNVNESTVSSSSDQQQQSES